MDDLLIGMLSILVVILLLYLVRLIFPTMSLVYRSLIVVGFLLVSWLTGKSLNNL